MKILIRRQKITIAPGTSWVVLVRRSEFQDPKLYYALTIPQLLQYVTKELNEATTLDAVSPK